MLNYNLRVCMMELDDDLLELPHVHEPAGKFKSQHSQKSVKDPPEENVLLNMMRLCDLMLYCSMTRLESL